MWEKSSRHDTGMMRHRDCDRVAYLSCVATCRKKVAITTEHVKQHIAKKPSMRVEVPGAG